MAATAPNAPRFAMGDLVRLTRGEMLQFNGADLTGAAKGQEFTVLKHGLGQKNVFVSFIKKGGELVAVTAPAESFELIPPTAWNDLLAGAEAFRDGRYAEMTPRFTRATQDAQLGTIASTLGLQMKTAVSAAGLARSADAARQPSVGIAFSRTLGGLRDAAQWLVERGYPTLALAIDQGVDRLATQVAAVTVPATKLDRDALAKRVETANRSLMLARQAMALRMGMEAEALLTDGLKAEPARPDLKAMLEKIQKDIAEAGQRCDDAISMRRFPKGAVHALTAIEMGQKLCADHPRLRALRKEMEALFAERTAPPVTPEFIASTGAKSSAEVLKAGHELYTTRCTDCHELELLDSRSLSGWQSTVAGMARRAHLSDAEQGRILEYLAAAKSSLRGEP